MVAVVVATSLLFYLALVTELWLAFAPEPVASAEFLTAGVSCLLTFVTSRFEYMNNVINTRPAIKKTVPA